MLPMQQQMPLPQVCVACKRSTFQHLNISHLQIVPDVPDILDILGLPLPHDAMLVSHFGMVLECLLCTFLDYDTHRRMTTSTLMTCLLMTKSTEAAASGGVLILGTDAHWCKIHIGQLGVLGSPLLQ